jgi:hypothetical protein
LKPAIQVLGVLALFALSGLLPTEARAGQEMTVPATIEAAKNCAATPDCKVLQSL